MSTTMTTILWISLGVTLALTLKHMTVVTLVAKYVDAFYRHVRSEKTQVQIKKNRENSPLENFEDELTLASFILEQESHTAKGLFSPVRRFLYDKLDVQNLTCRMVHVLTEDARVNKKLWADVIQTISSHGGKGKAFSRQVEMVENVSRRIYHLGFLGVLVCFILTTWDAAQGTDQLLAMKLKDTYSFVMVWFSTCLALGWVSSFFLGTMDIRNRLKEVAKELIVLKNTRMKAHKVYLSAQKRVEENRKRLERKTKMEIPPIPVE